MLQQQRRSNTTQASAPATANAVQGSPRPLQQTQQSRGPVAEVVNMVLAGETSETSSLTGTAGVHDGNIIVNKYMYRTLKPKALILKDALEDMCKFGDEDDSNEEEDEQMYHMVSQLEAKKEKVEHADVEVAVKDEFDNYQQALPGWTPSSATPDWKPPKMSVGKGEPQFQTVDNPGMWDEYVFRPIFDGKGQKYKGHQLPTGATLVPLDDKEN